MTYKDNILQLRAEGKSYSQIKTIVGCSHGVIVYYCGLGQKEKTKLNNIKYRNKHPFIKKIQSFTNKKLIKIPKKSQESIRRKIYRKLFQFNQQEFNNMITIEQLLEKFGPNPKCYLTGKSIDINQPRTYQFDHIIPRSKGGNNSLVNLGLSIKEANVAKNNLQLNEFIELCKQVVENFGYQVTK